MTLKESLQIEFKKLSEVEDVVFLGENIINSGRIYGTLNDVPTYKCIEMPVAENLIAGCAVGLAITGRLPICIFQRMDFMLIAADAIINHAALMPKMTGIKLPILFITFKATLKDSFYAGLQHTKDLSHVFEPYLPTIQITPLSNIRLISSHLPEEPTLLVIDHENLNNTLVSA